jgi:hypothetical protein
MKHFLAAGLFFLLQVGWAGAQPSKPLQILFLGDNGHHHPEERFRQLQPVLAARGIKLTYTERMQDLRPETLAAYDGLMIYANTESIRPEQEKALLDFVASGKGFIPIHCASYCFRNSPKYVELVGAQFQRHGTGVFRTTPVEGKHPLMQGFHSFESWDETYVHTKHNDKDRTVLEYREENGQREPWTWGRTHGKGRVFYTAWGHDERTWSHPGFQNLLERGIRWAVGSDTAQVPAYADAPAMTPQRTDVKPFEYAEANIPFYPPSPRWGVIGEPLKKMQKPLPPEESAKHMVHPADFELKLFVAEPQLGGKPIAMNWDERGRLWVAVTVDYPNELKPPGQGRDKIVICEDTTGKGMADKITVFADKLSLPTSLTFARGGVIVHQPPHTLFLRDTNGDDVADERTILFTGWGTGDTHAGPSNLVQGLDNWIYGIVGYSGFRGEIGGERHSFMQGIYRFKPDGSKMELLRNTSNNSWGVGMSEEGLLFGSTANGCPSVYLPIPNRYYESVRGWSSQVLRNIALSNRFHPITDKVRQVDYHGGFTAAAGHALYTARTYPPEYWNRTAFVCEPTGHLAATFVLQRHGTDFIARYGWNLVASDDEWTSPIMAEVGPDGNVWFIDWYNFIVQHNPTPPGFRTGKGNAYETDLRDKKHGRIYRLVYKHGKPSPPLSLKNATPEKLVATLKHENMFWRKHAQRLLVERGKDDVKPALRQLVADTSVDEIGLNVGAIHALWTLHGLSASDDSLLEGLNQVGLTALRHPSAAVRRNAALVLRRSSPLLLHLLQDGLLKDPDPHVRLAALLALAEMPSSRPEAATAIVEMMRQRENMTDRWLPDALTCGAAKHDLPFLKEVAVKTPPLSEKARQIISLVSQHYARGGPTQTAGDLIVVLADADPTLAEIVLTGLAQGWPRNRPAALNEQAEAALLKLLARLPQESQGHLIRLGLAWGSKKLDRYAGEITQSLLALANDTKQPEAQRIAAVKQLAELRATDNTLLEKLLGLITPRTSPTLALAILEAVGGNPTAGQAILERLASWPPTVRAAALRGLLSRPESTRPLLDAMENGQVMLSELALDQKQALANHPDAAIASRAKALLAKGGGLPSADRQKVLEEYLLLAKTSGDAAKGKLLFKKHCATCHTHSGEGANIGPDLSGVAVHTKEHLLTDILDPSRNVEGNYRVYTVLTTDGRIFNGLLAAETRTTVELIDSEAKKHLLLRENIEEMKASPKSLMPDGFEKQMTKDELGDLLAFLTQRGKYLPLPLNKVATVVTTKGMFYGEQNNGERLIFRDWKPKTFAGVPFVLVDPQGNRVPNAVMLYGPQGAIPPTMPRTVQLPCNAPVKAIHFLSGISGWGYPASAKDSVSMIVRLEYADGQTEDHPLLNGVHFADYIRRVDVPGSQFAFSLRGQQLRYLAIQPKRPVAIQQIHLVKGPDATAPVVMAVTLEMP